MVLIGAQTAALLLGSTSLMRRLPAWMRYQCVATPGFAREHFAGGLTLPDVLEATAILFDRKDALHDVFFGLRLGVAVGRYPRHYFPSPTALLNAILDELGYGQVPAMQVEPMIREGRLVALAPERDLMIDLYWPHWEQEPEPLATISALVMNAARRSLVQSVPTAAHAG
ncbi:DNA-binding transcriptional LysR family regulator [Paraburkholderia sp. WC7.3d]